DQVDMWIDPSSLGDDGNIPAATLTTGTASSSDASSLAYLHLNHAVSQTLWIDEVRVGTSWSDVTPTGAAPAGEKLGFTTQPQNGSVGAPLAPVVVQIQSAGGAAVASNGVPITVTLTAGTGTLGGTTTRDTDSSGKATFDDLTIDTAGSGKQITASASGIGAGLSDAISTTFSITQPGVATKLAFTTQPSTTVIGHTITPAVVVQIQDNEGSPVASNSVPVTLSLTTGSGTLNGTLTRDTDSNGRATFDDLNIDAVGAGKQLTATAGGIGAGLTETASSSFTITAAPPTPVNSAPVITQTLLTPAGVILRGTNGAPQTSYQVLTSTNTALPPAQWASIATNQFDTAGNFDCTNPAPSLLSQSFFRILSSGGNPSGVPDFSHVGFASSGITLTGGEGGPVVVVSNTAQLQQYTDSVGPYVIYVLGTIPVSGMSTHVRSHKTIIGIGTNATLDGGGLYMHGGSSGLNASNIIIRNLTIRNSTDDNIGITTGAKNIWVDHCTFYDSADGTMDIVKGADNVTVSWCKFYYTNPNNDHRFINLVGASDGEGNLDTGKLHVTFHHNWWGTLCDQRMTSVRFGRAHVYNNYYNATNNLYCVRSRLYAECRVENNYFSGVRNPWEVYVTSAGGTMGKVGATNNILVGTFFQGGGDNDGNTVVIVPGTDDVFTPPYAYTPDDAADVPALVREHAGAGKGPFAP
ncbi:MAG TPA: hypothetical protein PKA41_14080, partial [Verrucomicrobiota bacterium]|nr:hypothetical protein [Verrucomicrobiota bacterium]